MYIILLEVVNLCTAPFVCEPLMHISLHRHVTVHNEIVLMVGLELYTELG